MHSTGRAVRTPSSHSRYNSQTLPRHSYTSSSEDSFGRVQSHSRSASGTSETNYEDYTVTPPSKSLINHYSRTNSVLNGTNMDSNDVKTSMRLRYSDPMALHLLLETAMSDSQHFEVLAPEELEELKREESNLTRQIESGKRKLFLESRVSNTARTLQKLDSRRGRVNNADASFDKRRSPHGLSNGIKGERDSIMKSEKCEELAHNLWKLERRRAELRDKRLKHTSGVLQLNHQLQLHDGSYQQYSGNKDFDEEDEEDESHDLNMLLQSLPSSQPPSKLVDRLQTLSSSIRDTLAYVSHPNDVEPLRPPSGNVDAEEYIDFIEQTMEPLRDSSSKLQSVEETIRQTDSVLNGLWEILRANEEDLKRDRQEMRSANPKGLNGDAIFSSEEDEPVEPSFSIQGLSTKVQKLCEQATTMSRQQITLHEQLAQARDTLSNAESSRSAERSQLTEQLQEAHDKHISSEKSLEDVKAQLAESRMQLDETQKNMTFTKQQRDLEDSQNLKAERDARENSEKAMIAQLQAKDAEIDTIKSELSNHQVDAGEKSRRLEEIESERGNLEAAMIRLQTEVTVTRAELDAAYGTRAQRAAEVASNPELMKEIETLVARNSELMEHNEEYQSRAETLQKELKELVPEYESLVKQGVEAEKEREGLERVVDTLKDRIEEFEVRLADEKVKMLGRQNNNSPASPRTTDEDIYNKHEKASTGMMRNEFKKMMREAKAEHFRTLRAEQEERRKLEATIRSLRKEQNTTSSSSLSPAATPKSGLSKTVTVS